MMPLDIEPCLHTSSGSALASGSSCSVVRGRTLFVTDGGGRGTRMYPVLAAAAAAAAGVIAAAQLCNGGEGGTGRLTKVHGCAQPEEGGQGIPKHSASASRAGSRGGGRRWSRGSGSGFHYCGRSDPDFPLSPLSLQSRKCTTASLLCMTLTRALCTEPTPEP